MKRVLLAAAALLLATSSFAQSKAPIRVMLLDGDSNRWHKWQLITPVLKAELEETGLFDVDVVTVPRKRGQLTDFHPKFSDYDVVVWNYDAPDGRWSEELKKEFEDYVRGGGGFISVHASDNAFPGWEAFNEMIGVGGWRERNESSGPYWYYDDNGKLVSDTSPGKAGDHGNRVPFQIQVRADHPITNGLPKVWMHQGDELYSTLRGPGKNMTILATAYSDPKLIHVHKDPPPPVEHAGTGHHEPVLMVLNYGKGRVFHTTLGHDVNALSSVDFIVTFQRGTEWAATGKVTQKVPDDFPTAHSVSYRADIAAMDPDYVRGLNPLDEHK